jgi:hypothetical protein
LKDYTIFYFKYPAPQTARRDEQTIWPCAVLNVLNVRNELVVGGRISF